MALLFLVHTTLLSVPGRAKILSPASPLASSPLWDTLTLHILMLGTHSKVHYKQTSPVLCVFFYFLRVTALEELWMPQQSSSARRLIAACCPWSLSTRWRRMASWSWALDTESSRWVCVGCVHHMWTGRREKITAFLWCCCVVRKILCNQCREKQSRPNKENFEHRLLSLLPQINNPDMRVQILKDFVKQHFPSSQLLDYALEVEKITTSKVRMWT